MHDSDELDDILNEIRNRQNPHTEDTQIGRAHV